MDVLRENIGLLYTYRLTECCAEAFAVLGDDPFLTILEAGLSDQFVMKKLGFKDEKEANEFFTKVGTMLNKGEIVSDNDARKYNLMIRHSVFHNTEDYSSEKELEDNYKYSKNNLDTLRRRRLGVKKEIKDSTQKGFYRGLLGGVVGSALTGAAIGGGIYAYKQYKNKPRSVIAKRIAALRSIYKKFMINAQRNPQKANVLQRMAAKILNVIDKLLGFLQNKADGR